MSLLLLFTGVTASSVIEGGHGGATTLAFSGNAGVTSLPSGGAAALVLANTAQGSSPSGGPQGVSLAGGPTGYAKEGGANG